MSLAVVVATVAQLLDLSTFLRMIALYGPVAEANPLVSQMLTGHGMPFVAVTKIAGLALIVSIVAVLAASGDRQRSPRLAAVITALAIGAGVLGGWTNARALI